MTTERLSKLSQGMVGSEILKIAAEVREMVAQGKPICNLTVGDFSPSEFKIPERLTKGVSHYVEQGQTNYPPPNGVPELRTAVVSFYKRWLGIDTPIDGVVITAGGRPVIYGAFKTLVNAGDRVVYPVPSWNNNHYTYLVGAKPVEAPLRRRYELSSHGGDAQKSRCAAATLLVLNSPANPSGTVFSADQLGDICDVILEENARRTKGERPLYLMYDQIYWMLTFGGAKHVNPVSLRPEMSKVHTVMVDGISKAFAATGLRVGWGVGPVDVIKSMADLLTHIGAWAPRPEQMASADLLCADDDIRSYHAGMLREVQERLNLLAGGINALKEQGFPVDTTTPSGAIYLSARFALHGKRTPEGEGLHDNEGVRRYLYCAPAVSPPSPSKPLAIAPKPGGFVSRRVLFLPTMCARSCLDLRRHQGAPVD